MIKRLKSYFYSYLNPKIRLLNDIKNLKIYVANVGSFGENDFSGLFWSKVSQYCYFFRFDPNNDKKLETDNYIIFPYGLWSEEITKEIFLTRFSDASSLFEPNQNQLSRFINYSCHEVVNKKKINLKTLDKIIDGENFSYCDFIKIDAEGSELNILNGGKNNLDNAIGLELEINFFKKNINSPHAAEVLNFCRNNDFDLYILNRESWRKNKIKNVVSNYQLIWSDAIFFKTESRLSEKLKVMEKDKRKVIISKLILLLINYRLYDTVDCYLNFFKKKDLIDDKELKFFRSIAIENIENNFIIILKTFLLFIIILLFLPFSYISFSKKLINLTISFLRILFIRLLTLILNLFRYSGPNKVAISDNLKTL